MRYPKAEAGDNVVLIELRNYVVERGRVSMRDLVRRFEKEPEAIRAMLEHWIRKGRIEREVACPPCGTACSSCDSSLTEFYVAKA